MLVVIFIVFVAIFMATASCQADVGWARLPRSVIHTKVPGEIRVMIIDTGIGSHSKLKPWVQYQETEDYKDNHGHGTHIAGITVWGNLVKHFNFDYSKYSKEEPDLICSKVKIFSCKYFDPTHRGNDNMRETINCIHRAIIEKMDVINYSGGGTEPNIEEYKAYTTFVKGGGTVFVAAGNEHSSLEVTPYYPASYSILPNEIPKIDEWLPENGKKFYRDFYAMWKPLSNFYVMEALDWSGNRLRSSNWHQRAIAEFGEGVYSMLPNENYGLMTGTSQATPAYLHEQLKLKCQEVF